MIEEEVEACGVAVDEASCLKCFLGRVEVGAADHDIDILCVSYCGLINSGYPCGDGVVSSEGMGDAGALKGGGSAEESVTNLFHGIHHPLKEIARRRKLAGHSGWYVSAE